MIVPVINQFAAACTGGSFFGLPKWYKYLSCTDGNAPELNNINNIWLIGAAIIEILVRVGALVAVGFVIYGGIQYVISQGEPDKLAKARHTIIDALVGLVIAVAATFVITFVAGRFN